MKRNLLLGLAVILILAGLFLITRVIHTLSPSGQGALQITANIKSDVYLNDELIGQTPLCKCEQNNTVKQGDYSVRIVPQDKSMDPFIAKITVSPGVLTAVERTFLPGSLASAYILTLEKTNQKEPQLMVSTIPDSAMIAIDSSPRGASPYLLENIAASEHEVEIQKEGFAKKTIRVRTVPEYKLVVAAFLGTQSAENFETTRVSPTASPTSTPEQADVVEIQSTPVGFLRVRSQPNTSGTEITTVDTGEKFPFTEEQNGWYKITIDEDTEGWVSGTYVQEVNQ